jgi:Flp pilus assembly protein TadG
VNRRNQTSRRGFRKRLGISGTAGIEFGLAVPMLVLLTTGSYDFGSALYQENRLIAAARAGVQYGIQSSSTWTDTTDITTAVRNDAGDATDSLTVTATTCTCPGGTSPCSTATACSGSTVSGTYVKVVVTESYSTLVSYPFITSPFTISGQALVRVE